MKIKFSEGEVKGFLFIATFGLFNINKPFEKCVTDIFDFLGEPNLAQDREYYGMFIWKKEIGSQKKEVYLSISVGMDHVMVSVSKGTKNITKRYIQNIFQKLDLEPIDKKLTKKDFKKLAQTIWVMERDKVKGQG